MSISKTLRELKTEFKAAARLIYAEMFEHGVPFPSGRAGEIMKEQGWSYIIDEAHKSFQVAMHGGGPATFGQDIIVLTPDGRQTNHGDSAYLHAVSCAYHTARLERNNSCEF